MNIAKDARAFGLALAVAGCQAFAVLLMLLNGCDREAEGQSAAYWAHEYQALKEQNARDEDQRRVDRWHDECFNEMRNMGAYNPVTGCGIDIEKCMEMKLMAHGLPPGKALAYVGDAGKP